MGSFYEKQSTHNIRFTLPLTYRLHCRFGSPVCVNFTGEHFFFVANSEYMPGMTMVFVVKDTSMLDKINAGDKISFMVIKENGKLTVTDIQPAQ